MESEQMQDVDMLNIHPEEDDDDQMETQLLNGSGDEVRVNSHFNPSGLSLDQNCLLDKLIRRCLINLLFYESFCLLSNDWG